MTAHPAKFSDAILEELRRITIPESIRKEGGSFSILDPFAGTGRIHSLGNLADTTGVELEPEWAALHPRTIVGDATALPFPDASFDAVMTSPCYGNRMADHHDARDGSYRITYRHLLGRPLTEGNAGALQWGDDYRALHTMAWVEAVRVVRPGGLVVVNVSNHVRGGVVQRVVEWHLGALFALGQLVEAVIPVPTRRMRQGANAEARCAFEHVLVTRRPL